MTVLPGCHWRTERNLRSSFSSGCRFHSQIGGFYRQTNLFLNRHVLSSLTAEDYNSKVGLGCQKSRNGEHIFCEWIIHLSPFLSSFLHPPLIIKRFHFNSAFLIAIMSANPPRPLLRCCFYPSVPGFRGLAPSLPLLWETLLCLALWWIFRYSL